MVDSKDRQVSDFESMVVVDTINGDTKITFDRSERFLEHRVSMSAEAADAMKEQSKMQYAVPAIEKTKQEQQRTMQHGLTVFGAIAGLTACVISPAIAPYAVGIVTVLGGVYAVNKLLDKKSGAR